MSSRFVNIWDSGVKESLVIEVAAALDAHPDGAESNLRFIGVRQASDAPPSIGERRILVGGDDPMALVKRLRKAAKRLGIRQFYVPKALRGSITVGANDARWLRQRGHSAQTIADLFGVSQRSAWVVCKGVKPRNRLRKNHGDTFADLDFKVGADWLRGRRLPGDPTSAKPHEVDELTELLGPARIARCGAALRELRAAERPDPPAVK